MKEYKAKLIFNNKLQDTNIQLLFYTYVNTKYFDFAILYPLFLLTTNPYASVEICVENHEQFIQKYSELISWYNEYFPNKVLYSYTQCDMKIRPSSMRFVIQPASISKYIYIGDVDILITDENILSSHILNIEKNNLDYSNIERKNIIPKKLSGLHFIEYSKIFPLDFSEINDLDLYKTNAEVLLHIRMQRRGFKVPTVRFRPVHGVHITMNRAPLQTITTRDTLQTTTPPWSLPSEFIYIEKYLKIRYTNPIINFMKNINPNLISLRRTIQFADMYAHYISTMPSPLDR